MKLIYCVIAIKSHFVEISRVAKLLKNSGEYNFKIWFMHLYEAIESDLKVCESEGWEYVTPLCTTDVSQNGLRQNGESAFQSIHSFIPSKVRIMLHSHPLLFFPILLPFFWLRFSRQLAYLDSFLKVSRPDLLIMADDSLSFGSYFLIRLGHRMCIPTVIVPFAMSNPKAPAEFFYDNPAHIVKNNFINRFIAYKYPHWTYNYNNRCMLRLPIWKIIPLEYLGFAPNQPWIYLSEETSVIAVENQRTLNFYLNEGLPAERLILTGALFDDVLAEGIKNKTTYRKELCTNLNLDPDLPILLCATPPNQFPRKCEFANYTELVNYWMESLKNMKEWNVVIRPHPRASPSDIALMEKYNLKITQLDTASLVPLCDLYVASVSATIRWAIACGIPVINYDVYQYHYRDYVNVEGVITITDKESFESALREITSESDFYNNMVSHQKECMSDWGYLDGKSGERMLDLFKEIISKQKK